ncbi:RagB/SusD family nutrient uptake outer membrane protein [Bacteroides sedimenti]|uniref:Membrane protein n=1 Tax=Bacteroides sedimenti TaxID=2136147 RepID=A0ABN6Z4J3_9BACE
MKTIKSIIFSCAVLATSAFFTSCDKLDLAPIDNYASGNFWNTVPQVQGYMYGMHTRMRDINFTRNFLLGEARGGTNKSGTSSVSTSLDYDRIKENNLDASNTGVSGWAGLYGYIFDSNLMIQKVEGSELQKNNKAAIDYALGQAYGIRAMYYFYLYRTFGGVPLVDKVKVMDGQVSPADLYTPRSTPKQTMDFIKADLKKSLDYFASSDLIPTGTNRCTWSKAASTMLAAEVYLWSAKVSLGDQVPAASDLDAAEGYLNTILNSSSFGMLPSFSSVFDATSTATKENKEIIFSLRYLEGEYTNGNIANFVPANANFLGSVYDGSGNLISADVLNLKNTGLLRHEYVPTLWQAYDANDTRRGATFFDFYNKDKSLKGVIWIKSLGYVNSSNVRIYCGDQVVYRYADALLLMAEVQNMKDGDVAKYINQVRARAYNSKWDPAVYGYTNSDFKTNELAILHERDLEFVNEGTRWFDVCRMKDAKNGKPLAFSSEAAYKGKPILDYTTEKHKLLWPIDITTLNSDPTLKQTPGYTDLGQETENW